MSHCEGLCQPEIQAFPRHRLRVFSTNSPTHMLALASVTFLYFQMILCQPSLHGGAIHAFGRIETTM